MAQPAGAHRIPELIGLVCLADTEVEDALRHAYQATVGPNPAALLARRGFAALHDDLSLMVRDGIDDGEQRTDMLDALKEAAEAHQLRNELVHSRWVAPWPDDEDQDAFNLYRPVSKGIGSKRSRRRVEELEDCVRRLEVAAQRLLAFAHLRVSAPSTMGAHFRLVLKGRVVRDGNGWRSIPEDQDMPS